MNDDKRKSPKTESEKLFQRYLESRELRNFEYHPRLPGSKKRPDFCLKYAGKRILLEVKELDPPQPDPQVMDQNKALLGKDEARKTHATRGGFKICARWTDPCLRICTAIEEAWKQLRDFPNDICCIVLYDTSTPGATKLGPEDVYGAILGRVRWFIPHDPQHGFLPEESFPMFSPEGGEMRWETGEPHKNNISAILVLDQFPVGKYRFFSTAPARNPALSSLERAVGTHDAMKLSRGTQRHVSYKEVRVIVHQNPSATRKLPRDIFCGPYDVRYGEQKGRIERISAGREIRKLEAQGAIPRSPLLEIARRSARKGKAMSKYR
jgi:hypothetical protein